MSKHPKDDITVVFDHASPEVELKGQTIVQLDNEGNFLEAHSYGSFVERVEGGMRFTRPDGATLNLIDGEMTIENLVPKSVGILDLSEVESFAVRTVNKARIYRINFFGGGHLEVAYSQDGQVMKYTGRSLKQTLTQDNELMVGQYDSAGAQGH